MLEVGVLKRVAASDAIDRSGELVPSVDGGADELRRDERKSGLVGRFSLTGD